MNKELFREKSIDKISSPEDLGSYLRVTKPIVFIIMFATILVLAGLFIWSYFMSITSYAYGKAVVDDGVMVATFEDYNSSKYINDSMNVVVNTIMLPIDHLSMDEKGNIVTISSTGELPEGEYDVKIGYRQTKIIDMLLN